jgi:hypothetical protein
MRFANAVGILALPEKGFRSPKWRNEKRRMQSQSEDEHLLQRMRRELKYGILSSIPQVKPAASVLKNENHLRQNPFVECDPFADADVGILACGDKEYCQEVDSEFWFSEEGGVCVADNNVFDNESNSTDSGEGDLFANPFYIASTVCNSSSFAYNYFMASCDCTNFDQSTLTGTFGCNFGVECANATDANATYANATYGSDDYFDIGFLNGSCVESLLQLYFHPRKSDIYL